MENQPNNNDSAVEWIKQNIFEGTYNQNFRSRYLSKLGISQSYIEDSSKVMEKEPQSPNKYTEFEISIMQKTDEQIRQNYLQKLINNNILKIQPSKKQQTITIFDWDDTLLCTSFLSRLGFIDLPIYALAQISMLDKSVHKVLTKALSNGYVYIITNAAEGWVQQSALLYFPMVNSLLTGESKENEIKIISARKLYEEIYPGDSHKWKQEAFKNLIKYFDKNIMTNLICMGDQNYEIDAVHVLAQQFSFALTKTIKFRENPSPEELIKQQELVNDKFEQIFVAIKNLTIRLEKKQQNEDGID